MRFSDQVKLVRASKQLHSSWYRETYPDVAALKMDPAAHYLRYGAAMGRNPGRNFDTRFYLETCPGAAGSGLNPLVHYALRGREGGHAISPPPEVDLRRPVRVLRTKLLSLGFTDRPLADLAGIATTGDAPETRAAAARELALWHMRDKTDDGYRTALDWIARARADAPDLGFRAKLATVEILCRHFLGQPAAGRAAYDRAALAGEVTPDVMLARVNFGTTPEGRVHWINQVLARYGTEPLALLPGDGRAPYDRLTCADDLPKVTDGPKVTVLIAAYDADDTLPTALRALQEQTWANLEIIVLDDCSPTPGTVAVAERFAATDPRIRVIRMEQNAGAYVARNRGLDAATGEFVTLHDADDWSHPRKIETQVRFLIANPGVMGCKSDQARACSGLGFTRWTGQGQFIIPNTSSFMFRKAAMKEHLGYWDTVRFSADNELVRRMRRVFGRSSVVFMDTGPLSFQRDSDGSIIADDVLGVNGFMFGARKEYLDAQNHARKREGTARYGGDPLARPFPAPALMLPDRARIAAEGSHVNVVVATDLRIQRGCILSVFEELHCAREHGISRAIFELNRYDDCSGGRFRAHMLDAARTAIQETRTRILTFGESVTCDLLILRDASVLQEHQRYIPKIDAKEIRVIVTRPPMSDHGPGGEFRYALDRCAGNVRRYFGRDATWHPAGPLVRAALHTHHAEQLHHIDLSARDWHDIIDMAGWDRGPRVRGPRDRLRIGRHARDHAHEWPDSADDILAAWPDADDVEVHVLGGADTPSRILGYIPANWVVHEFGSIHPRDFLRDIDIWVYFARPGRVEGFGRAIIEAMAAGVPVILPEACRPLFGDAALYATPQGAMELARGLHADPAAYDRHVARARDHVRTRFSHAVHLERLRAAGVNA